MASPSIEFYNKAVDAVQAGKLPEALQAIENSLTEDPKDAQSYQLYAVILTALGRSEDAAKATAKVQEMGISETDSLIMKAADAASVGELGKAISLYEDAIELEPERFELHVSYALALLEEGYHKDALEATERALELETQEASVWYARGRVLRLTNQKQEAMECLEEATTLNPNLIPAVYEKGMLLAEAGQGAQALGCFETVLKAHPEDPAALEAKAVIKKGMREG